MRKSSPRRRRRAGGSTWASISPLSDRGHVIRVYQRRRNSPCTRRFFTNESQAPVQGARAISTRFAVRPAVDFLWRSPAAEIDSETERRACADGEKTSLEFHGSPIGRSFGPLVSACPLNREQVILMDFFFTHWR
jgi:hypothetical protein